jgi:PAS domain S-box-containing protein
MTESDLHFKYLREPQLAAHALNPAPVWLWNTDADRILWANPVGAAIFDAPSPSAIATRTFEPRHTAAVQIARLVGTLPQGGAPRLERLRGFGASFGGTLVCLCSRVTLTDNRAAVLVVSAERAGQELALPERARRLLENDGAGAAIFTADGELIQAQPKARERLGNKLDLIAFGADKLAREATLNGAAEGETHVGQVNILKLGAGATFALLVLFGMQHSVANAAAREPERPKVLDPAQAEPTSPQPPFRFVWQTDADGVFTLASQDFADLLGPKTAATLNRKWHEIAQVLHLDSGARITHALGAQETFSGIIVSWPADQTDERIPAEMSGLPVFDRDRQFKGFRGFGICRDTGKLADIRRRRAARAEPPAIVSEPDSKVLPFPSAPPPPAAEKPTLNARERTAFQELARELSERLKRPSAKSETKSETKNETKTEAKTETKTEAKAPDDFGIEPILAIAPPTREPSKAGRDAQDSRAILDRLPVGILVYRLNTLIYANRAFLEWTDYPSLEALSEAGGLDSLFIDAKSESSSRDAKSGGKTLTIATVNGKQKPVEGRLFSAVWNEENALVLVINTQAGADVASADNLLRRENDELRAILDTATDGVLVLDRSGRVLSANRSAEALFGYAAKQFAELSVGELLVPESRNAVLEHLDRLARGARASMLDAGYEVIGRVRQGGLVPLYMTMGRIEDGEKLCAVLRDITAWKRSEEELVGAKRAAEQASTAKSEFLAKISHEIRTPLNAIIGFSEVMMDERFGPIGNERYRQYLKDIHSSGGHLISLVNDLLDLSKIEAGKLELTFVSVNLNDLVQQCVAIMQEQANRERVIIRTSLPANLPQIVADTRSMRQIALNLLSNSIKFTGAGGQIIISTALTDEHEVVLRVRDTGTGMSEKELQTALEPFRQVATAARWGSSGTGLGLPITKALAEANHARFRITSHVEDGTLVELAFPSARVLAR